MSILKKFLTSSSENSKELGFMLGFVCSLPFPVVWSNFALLAFALYIIAVLALRRKTYPFNAPAFNSIIWLPLLYGIFGLSMMYSEDKSTAAQLLGRMAPLLLCPVAISFLNFTPQEKKTILNCFVVANLLAILLLLGRAFWRSIEFIDHTIIFDSSVLRGQGFWYSITQGGNYFFYEQFSSFMHPTYWSLYLVLCLAVLVDQLEQGKTDGIPRAWVIVRLLIIIVAFFQCSSRIVILSAILASMIFIFRRLVRGFNWVYVSSLALVLLVIGIFMANPRFGRMSDPEFTLDFVNRFRLNGWQSAIEIIKQNPIFGVGIGDTEKALNKIYENRGYVENLTNNYNEHNQYLHIATSVGLTGLILFVIALGKAFSKALTNVSLIQFVFILSFILACAVENILVRRAGVMYFSFFYSLLFSGLFSPKTQESK